MSWRRKTRSYGVTTVGKTSAPLFRIGPKSGTSVWIHSASQAATKRQRRAAHQNSPLRVAVSVLLAFGRFRTSPSCGCGPTITTAPAWPWAASPQSSSWPRLQNRSTSELSGNRGDYQSRSTWRFCKRRRSKNQPYPPN
jgi:hypothetical protein